MSKVSWVLPQAGNQRQETLVWFDRGPGCHQIICKWPKSVPQQKTWVRCPIKQKMPSNNVMQLHDDSLLRSKTWKVDLESACALLAKLGTITHVKCSNTFIQKRLEWNFRDLNFLLSWPREHLCLLWFWKMNEWISSDTVTCIRFATHINLKAGKIAMFSQTSQSSFWL